MPTEGRRGLRGAVGFGGGGVQFGGGGVGIGSAGIGFGGGSVGLDGGGVWFSGGDVGFGGAGVRFGDAGVGFGDAGARFGDAGVGFGWMDAQHGRQAEVCSCPPGWRGWRRCCQHPTGCPRAWTSSTADLRVNPCFEHQHGPGPNGAGSIPTWMPT